MNWLAVAVAGAVGAVAPYGLGITIGVRSFPWATLSVNVSGSFALAFLLAGPMADRPSAPATLAATVGFLGAFTTFSTFGYETVALVRADRPAAAAAYVAASTALGLAGAAFGYWLGRLGAS
ncbi:MAG: CrcB family protein [Acidimicrobiia bacterium]